ncbi:FHA domain-containing protein [Nocardia sp. CA-135953]|uniref:FHA domain-containing protein n=1 Tax=Nocardia sp. CA-135953 TaxID=3239978 RepID=UPI003D953FD4
MLDDARVSREHARIVPRENRIFIRDRDSANGIYVNGVPIGPHSRTAMSSESVPPHCVTRCQIAEPRRSPPVAPTESGFSTLRAGRRAYRASRQRHCPNCRP